jgi:hypothetical protein
VLVTVLHHIGFGAGVLECDQHNLKAFAASELHGWGERWRVDPPARVHHCYDPNTGRYLRKMLTRAEAAARISLPQRYVYPAWSAWETAR